MVFQLLLSPKREAVPIVRDFMLQPAEPVGFERLGAVSR
jgi:hypothetical protein